MAISRQQRCLLFLVAAAASLPFFPLAIDARATPESHFSMAKASSENTPSVSGGGYALYGADSALTATELYRIESQFDKDDDDNGEKLQKSHAVPESRATAASTTKAYGADPYGTKGVGYSNAFPEANRRSYGSGEGTAPYRFGDDRVSGTYGTNQYGSKQQESSIDGYMTNGQTSASTTAQSYLLGNDFYPNEFGSRQQESSQSTTTPIASAKAQSYRFGADFNYNTNDFGTKQQESSWRQSNPNTYGTYRISSNNNYNGNANADTNTNKYFGMSDTRRPENQRIYYNAAKGSVNSYRTGEYNNNKQSQAEYFNSQGMELQP